MCCCWVTGNRQLRRTTVQQHGNPGLHCKSLALWESGGTSTTVIGTSPAPIRRAINGRFQVVYHMAKRGSPPAHIPGDAEALILSGGNLVHTRGGKGLKWVQTGSKWADFSCLCTPNG